MTQHTVHTAICCLRRTALLHASTGTNFDKFFPEIHWTYGYAYFWGCCLFITVCFTALLQRLGMFESGGTLPPAGQGGSSRRRSNKDA